jgi:hypothetical protein
MSSQLVKMCALQKKITNCLVTCVIYHLTSGLQSSLRDLCGQAAGSSSCLAASCLFWQVLCRPADLVKQRLNQWRGQLRGGVEEALVNDETSGRGVPGLGPRGGRAQQGQAV